MKKDPFFEYFINNRNSVSQGMFKESNSYKIKEYSRFVKITLPEPRSVSVSYEHMVKNRESVREYSETALSLNQLSDLLYWSFGYSGLSSEKGLARRAYPSGGGKYPVEIYILILKKGTVPLGLYHYNVKSHSLEHISMYDMGYVLSPEENQDAFVKKSGAIIFFSFVKGRSVEKYGALAYKLAFLEAGHISQNMYLLAKALGLGVCGLGGVGDYSQKMHFSTYDEFILYRMSIGVLL